MVTLDDLLCGSLHFDHCGVSNVFGPLKSLHPQDFACCLVDCSPEVIQLWVFPSVYVNELTKLPATIKCDRVVN